jgi:hypothetical protein
MIVSSIPFVPAKAGTQFFLDSRFRGNERSKSKAAANRNRRRCFHAAAKPVKLASSKCMQSKGHTP